MGVNDYFYLEEQPDHMQHITMDLGNQILNMIITDIHILPGKLACICGNLENWDQEVMYSSEYFNSNHMEFVGYDTCEK